MPFSGTSYDFDTLALLTRAFDEAWHEIQLMSPNSSEADLPITRKMMALRIMQAANKGERDLERLKLLALQAIAGRDRDEGA